MWCDTGPLHVVQRLSDFLQVGNDTSVRVKGTISARAGRQGFDVQLLRSAGVDLEME